MTPVPAPITQQQVDGFVSLNARYKALKAERDTLRDEIVNSMLAGHHLPDDGPFTLNLVRQCRSTGSWKEACESVISLLGQRLQAKALALVEEEFGEETQVYQLTPAPNPKWQPKENAV